MSRSFRHTPIVGMACADSEKYDKRTWHSRFRTHERDNLLGCVDWDEFQTTDRRAVSDTWTMSKDGRQYIHRSSPYYRRALRK